MQGPAMSGPAGERVRVITGANSGVGLDCARRLASRGGTVVMMCRNAERGGPAVDAVRSTSGNPDVHLVVADLASFAQVRDAGAEIARRWPCVDALVNNAGLATLERRITEDGFELTLQVNHLSHFLLTGLLAQPLRAARGRVVNVSSRAHRRSRLAAGSMEELLRGPLPHRGLRAYADSKLANLLFTFELARREAAHGVAATALHPGVLSTAIWDRNRGWTYWAAQLLKRFMEPPTVGGEAAAWLADDPALTGVTGRYYAKREPERPSRRARDADLGRELWERSAEAVAPWLSTREDRLP